MQRRGFLVVCLSAFATKAAAHEVVVPESASDHTGQLQDAIDKAISESGVLELGVGQFKCSALNITAPLVIRGAGARSVLSGTGPILNVTGADVLIDNVSFVCDGKDQSIVSGSDAERIRIHGCQFKGGGKSVALERCSGQIHGCTSDDAEVTGLFARDSMGLVISDNTVSNCGNNGIQVWRSEIGEDGTLVTGNQVKLIAAREGGNGQNGNGINVFRAGNVIVANNRIADTAFSAIRNNAGANIIISGNSISRTAEVAIYVEFEFNGAVVSNNVLEDVAFGISLTNLDVGGRLAACEGNVIRNVHGGVSNGVKNAIAIHAEADAIISGNLIEDVKEIGISLGWGEYARNLSAQGNTLLRCAIGIAPQSAGGAGPILIANNLIQGASDGAIIAFDHEKKISGDLAAQGAELPKGISVQGNTVTP